MIPTEGKGTPRDRKSTAHGSTSPSAGEQGFSSSTNLALREEAIGEMLTPVSQVCLGFWHLQLSLVPTSPDTHSLSGL